jgi:hypothetical protein
VTATDISTAGTAESLTVPPAKTLRAFGLDVECAAPFGSLATATGVAMPRRVRLDVHPPGDLKDVWPPESRTLVDRSFRAGRPMMRVEAHPELGYRIWAPGHGRHLVSADGASIDSVVPRAPDIRWQRLLLAQPLPLAALLQGLELFHASAVELDGRTVAFVAASGTGKTSLAAHLVAGGAGFVTDDVLALEAVAGTVVAHPGANVLHLSEAELSAMEPQKRVRLGAAVGQSDKTHLRVPVSGHERQLAAVYFLERSSDFGELAVHELAPPEPRRLLASTFVSYVDLPSRLIAQLDFCAEFARAVRAFDVRVPLGFGAASLAEQIREHGEREL